MDAPPEAAASEQDGAFGARLRRAREAAGFAQEELAARAGLSPNAVGDLERGEHRRPYPATVRALASALGLTAEQWAALAASVPKRGDRAGAPAHTSGRSARRCHRRCGRPAKIPRGQDHPGARASGRQ